MNNYDDIINLPHHISKKHKQMSIESRAAQFAPFAALTGYSDAIEETIKNNEENWKKEYKKKKKHDLRIIFTLNNCKICYLNFHNENN